MTNKKQEILNSGYYVNFDHQYFKDLTRAQVAFVCLVNKLNKANTTATNKEISGHLGITLGGSYVAKIIKAINEKHPGLIKLDFNVTVNHTGKIMSNDKDCYSHGRNIILTRPLHIKGETYINLPNFAIEKRSCFLSSNELRVFAYLKAMPDKQFTGLLRVISKKLGLSLGIIKRALKKLAAIKAIKKKWMYIKHHLKNINYSINKLVVNTEWIYEKQKVDETINIRKKHQNDHEQESSWDDILESLGGEL